MQIYAAIHQCISQIQIFYLKYSLLMPVKVSKIQIRIGANCTEGSNHANIARGFLFFITMNCIQEQYSIVLYFVLNFTQFRC